MSARTSSSVRIVLLASVSGLLAAAACEPAPLDRGQAEALGAASEAITLPPVNAGDLPVLGLAGVGCADGSVEQTFSGGIVGCAGSVTYPNRATLCGAGYHPMNAITWKNAHAFTTPTHHYWTNDALSYGGTGSGNCSARFSEGTACPANEPMRVCASANTDPEGNRCNWFDCALDTASSTPNDFMGGCAGNSTAGTLCVPDSGCADGSVEQVFARGMVGCAGSVPWVNAGQLCTAGYALVEEIDWIRLRNGAVPTHNYWTANPSLHYSGFFFSCFATSNASDPTCPTGSPMRICTSSGTDPEGNQCNWRNCDSSSSASTSTNEYLGGCVGNVTAGALCGPVKGCADGTIEQMWSRFIYGCAGSVSWPNRDSLCGPHAIAMPVGVWGTFGNKLAPTHNYWTGHQLGWGGSGSGNCWVSQSTGFSCGMDQPMHICTSSGTDPEGNSCVWTHCGLDTTTPDRFFGGCGATAGTICMNGP